MNSHQLGFNEPAAYHQLFKQVAVSHRGLLDVIAARLLEPCVGILDAGCGTGIFTEMLASHFPHASVLGLDVSPEYINFAKAKSYRNNIDYFHSSFLDIKSFISTENTTHIFFKGSFHLMEKQIDFKNLKNLFFKNLRQIIIIEKTERSLCTYPVPDDADKRRREFVSKEWQKRRLEISHSANVHVVSFGRAVKIEKSVYIDAVMKRQFSYLASVTDQELEKWRNEFEIANGKYFEIFEENIAYIIYF